MVDHPKRPVMYSSVCFCPGLVKIFCVASISIKCPWLKNAVRSLIRAACCMLCVTITIV